MSSIRLLISPDRRRVAVLTRCDAPFPVVREWMVVDVAEDCIDEPLMETPPRFVYEGDENDELPGWRLHVVGADDELPLS